MRQRRASSATQTWDGCRRRHCDDVCRLLAELRSARLRCRTAPQLGSLLRIPAHRGCFSRRRLAMAAEGPARVLWTVVDWRGAILKSHFWGIRCIARLGATSSSLRILKEKRSVFVGGYGNLALACLCLSDLTRISQLLPPNSIIGMF